MNYMFKTFSHKKIIDELNKLNGIDQPNKTFFVKFVSVTRNTQNIKTLKILLTGINFLRIKNKLLFL